MAEAFKTIKIQFPRRLLTDLNAVAKDCGLSPAAFISQSAEVFLASRRLAAQINIFDSFSEPTEESDEDVLVAD